MNNRSEALAARLEAGAEALAAFAATLSETEWQTRVPKDGRRIGVVVHHVASMYPIEMQLARVLAAGQPITEVTWDGIDAINRDHAQENDAVTKEAALALLASNSFITGISISRNITSGFKDVDRRSRVDSPRYKLIVPLFSYEETNEKSFEPVFTS